MHDSLQKEACEKDLLKINIVQHMILTWNGLEYVKAINLSLYIWRVTHLV